MLRYSQKENYRKKRTKKQNQQDYYVFNVNRWKDVKIDKTLSKECWLGDTGASCHVTYDDSRMLNVETCVNDKVKVANLKECNVEKVGDVILGNDDKQEGIVLKGVRVVKDMGKHIISIGKLLEEGGMLRGNKESLEVLYKNKRLVFRRREKDGLYYMKVRRNSNVNLNMCFEVTDNENGWQKAVNKKGWKKINRDEAHRKWGHQHYDQMNWMANQCNIHLQGKLGECAGCALVKARAKANARSTKEHATEKGMRLFVDTAGPLPKSRGGIKYWQVAVDDYTDRVWVNFSPSKTHMTGFVEKLVTKMQGRGLKVKYIRCDNVGENRTLQERLQSKDPKLRMNCAINCIILYIVLDIML